MKQYLLAGLLLMGLAQAQAQSALAQEQCYKPTIKILYESNALPLTGSKFLANTIIDLADDGTCAQKAKFLFRAAEVTLIRNGRPVGLSLTVRSPKLSLDYFKNKHKPGDWIYLFIPYESIGVMQPNGSVTSFRYVQVEGRAEGKLDLYTDASKGVGYKWVLLD